LRNTHRTPPTPPNTSQHLRKMSAITLAQQKIQMGDPRVFLETLDRLGLLTEPVGEILGRDEIAEFFQAQKTSRKKKSLTDEERLGMYNGDLCDARVWKEKPRSGGIGYDNIQCSSKKVNGCLCKKHFKMQEEGALWTGLITESRPENPIHPTAGPGRTPMAKVWSTDKDGNEVVKEKKTRKSSEPKKKKEPKKKEPKEPTYSIEELMKLLDEKKKEEKEEKEKKENVSDMPKPHPDGAFAKKEKEEKEKKEKKEKDDEATMELESDDELGEDVPTQMVEYSHNGFTLTWNKKTNELIDPDDGEVMGEMIELNCGEWVPKMKEDDETGAADDSSDDEESDDDSD